MRFLIHSPVEYTWKVGGVVVLYKLGRMLANLGHDVYITAHKYNNVLADSSCKIINYEVAQNLCANSDVIAILPDVIDDNIYGAKYVVRWILYYPGVLGGPAKYDESEYVFTYQKRFVAGSEYEDAPLFFLMETNVDNFFPMNHNRNCDAYLVKKGGYSHERYSNYIEPYLGALYDNIIQFDPVIEDSTMTLDKLNDEFNKIRYFISFDHATYNSILAALAGCTSVVIPIEGLDKETWKKQVYPCAHGIAYGFDDIESTINTKDKLIENLREIESNNIPNVEKFVEMVRSKWNI